MSEANVLRQAIMVIRNDKKTFALCGRNTLGHARAIMLLEEMLDDMPAEPRPPEAQEANLCECAQEIVVEIRNQHQVDTGIGAYQDFVLDSDKAASYVLSRIRLLLSDSLAHEAKLREALGALVAVQHEEPRCDCEICVATRKARAALHEEGER